MASFPSLLLPHWPLSVSYTHLDVYKRQKVDRPKKNDFQPVFLDAAELQRLFEVVKGTKLELPVLVAAFYGLRRGEVLGLKWDAIDFERGTLTIKRTVTSVNVGGKTQIIEQESAKTKSSMRTLPLAVSYTHLFVVTNLIAHQKSSFIEISNSLVDRQKIESAF